MVKRLKIKDKKISLLLYFPKKGGVRYECNKSCTLIFNASLKRKIDFNLHHWIQYLIIIDSKSHIKELYIEAFVVPWNTCFTMFNYSVNVHGV